MSAEMRSLRAGLRTIASTLVCDRLATRRLAERSPFLLNAMTVEVLADDIFSAAAKHLDPKDYATWATCDACRQSDLAEDAAREVLG